MVISGRLYCSIWARTVCDVYVLDAERQDYHKDSIDSDLSLYRKDYDSSNGREVFLSYEDKDESVFGYLRLRMPSIAAHRFRGVQRIRV